MIDSAKSFVENIERQSGEDNNAYDVPKLAKHEHSLIVSVRATSRHSETGWTYGILSGRYGLSRPSFQDSTSLIMNNNVDNASVSLYTRCPYN